MKKITVICQQIKNFFPEPKRIKKFFPGADIAAAPLSRELSFKKAKHQEKLRKEL